MPTMYCKFKVDGRMELYLFATNQQHLMPAN